MARNKGMKIIRLLGSILIVGLIVIVILNVYAEVYMHEPLSYNFFYWLPGASKYHEIMKDYNKFTDKRIIGLGDIVVFEIPSKRALEGHIKKSINRYYELQNVIFKPSDDELKLWLCEDKPREWDELISGDMKFFKISININIPENHNLEGKTVDGILEARVIYPVKTTGGGLIGRFYNEGVNIDEPLSIHIFTNNELEELSTLRRGMNKFLNRILLTFFVGGIILWVSSCIIEGSWEFLKTMGMIFVGIMILLFTLYWLFWD